MSEREPRIIDCLLLGPVVIATAFFAVWLLCSFVEWQFIAVSWWWLRAGIAFVAVAGPLSGFVVWMSEHTDYIMRQNAPDR